MSWLYSRALVAEYSAEKFSAGKQSAPLSTTPTPQAYLSPDRMTDYSRPSRFGMTFAPLTVGLGADVLTWFLAGFPVRTSVPPERVPALMESAQGCGLSSLESLAKYNRDSRSWKIPQCSLLGDSETFSETWPRSGLMQDGVCWPQAPLVRPIDANGSGLLPTPTATTAKQGAGSMAGGASKGQPLLHMAAMTWQTPVAADAGQRKKGKWSSRGEPQLSAQVMMWPTPLATDGNKGGPNQRGGKGDLRLSSAVHQLPTPTVNDAKNSTLPPSQIKHDNIPGALLRAGEQPGGQLNPTWVEWLMGWPLGWTDLQPSATAKYPNAPPPHGKH